MEKIENFKTRINRVKAYRNFIDYHKNWHKEEGVNTQQLYGQLIRVSSSRAKILWANYTTMIRSSRDFIRGEKTFDEWRDRVEDWSMNVLDEHAILKGEGVKT